LIRHPTQRRISNVAAKHTMKPAKRLPARLLNDFGMRRRSSLIGLIESKVIWRSHRHDGVVRAWYRSGMTLTEHMRLVYETSLALRRSESRAALASDVIAEIEAERALTDADVEARTNAALMRWRTAVDDATVALARDRLGPHRFVGEYDCDVCGEGYCHYFHSPDHADDALESM